MVDLPACCQLTYCMPLSWRKLNVIAVAAQWPGVATEEVVPPHADLRLYGAAAFERCLQVGLHGAVSVAQPALCPASGTMQVCMVIYPVKSLRRFRQAAP